VPTGPSYRTARIHRLGSSLIDTCPSPGLSALPSVVMCYSDPHHQLNMR